MLVVRGSNDGRAFRVQREVRFGHEVRVAVAFLCPMPDEEKGPDAVAKGMRGHHRVYRGVSRERALTYLFDTSILIDYLRQRDTSESWVSLGFSQARKPCPPTPSYPFISGSWASGS